MKEKDIYSELSSIRNLMERSTKFFSLSGLSGIIAGVYALAGALIAYQMIGSETPASQLNPQTTDLRIWNPIFLAAFIVLCLSITTGILLTIRQSRKQGENFWNPVSKRLVVNFSIPLLAGAIFILILISKGLYPLLAPSCLIFYGLSLFSAGNYTFSDIKWLGSCEVVLGLTAALLPQYGFYFWIAGFGILHILYGSIMHFKYNQ